MKLAKLSVHGFRAFSSEEIIDLNSNVVIVTGPNGQGKTSILDAVLWCLTGVIPRLDGPPHEVISLYSDTGEARVSLEMEDANGRLIRVMRTCDPHGQSLRLDRLGETLNGVKARDALCKLLGVEQLFQSSNGQTDSGVETHRLASVLTRSVYLQQDLVRQFVDADSETERYESLAELFGTGRLTELQVELEKQKSNWTGATNRFDKEKSSLQERLSSLRTESERLRDSGDPLKEDLTAEWDSWWSRLRELGITESEPPGAAASDAPTRLDRVLRNLEAQRRSDDRRLSAINDLLQEVREFESIPRPDGSTEDLRLQVGQLESQLEELKGDLATAEQEAARQRRELVVEREREEDLSALAQIALRHLEERCPVCHQDFDKEQTRKRLEAMLDRSEAPGKVVPAQSIVQETAEKIERCENELREARNRLAELEAYEERLDRVRLKLSDAGFEATLGEDASESASRLQAELTNRISRWNDLQSTGERLSLGIAKAGEMARVNSLANEASAVENELATLTSRIDNRTKTGELAQTMIDALREAGQEIVEEELGRIQSFAQRIYAAIDPHPALREVKLKSWMYYGRGHAATEVWDPDLGLSSDSPAVVLSSSQVNALAVSIFLALNLGAREIPLQTAILDDPLQSLDDINILGLVDLLRRGRDRRQLIVSTHDHRFGTLLERKLRPISTEDSTSVIRVDAWTREGPTVTVERVPPSPQLYIVA